MLKDMSVMHPAAKMLVDLANAQDIEAGDGTTSVVVIAGSLLAAAEKLLAKGTVSTQQALTSSNTVPEPSVTSRPPSHRHIRIFPESCR